jgi:hypothetical protein
LGSISEEKETGGIKAESVRHPMPLPWSVTRGGRRRPGPSIMP